MNEYLTLVLTIASIIIPVYATIYTGHIRIRNENKEGHKPYLSLGAISQLSQLDRFSYFFIVIGKFFQKQSKEEILLESRKEKNLLISLAVKNIGYGVASNIKFYDLDTAKPILGVQEKSNEINQKKFTTLDISKDSEKKVFLCMLTALEDGVIQPDQHRILCVYQDLNHNIYDFIIGIDVKQGGTYDFFAYQRSSHSYKFILSSHKSKYKAIMKKYKV